MREIKFRGYHESTKQLVYGYYSKDDAGFTWIKKDDEIHYLISNVASIGQYTGLKDKNGKEIFEGDIVTYNNFNSLRTGGHAEDKIIVGKVVFDFGMWIVESIDYSQDLYEARVNDEEILVIGNIYGNPELLQTKGDN